MGGARQDMPPTGGYRRFNYGRTFPKTLWRPGVVVAAVAGITTYGVYDAKKYKARLVTEKFEDQDIMCSMEPFLTAERDRNWLRLLKKNRELEAKVMEGVPGWKVGTWYGEPIYLTLGEKWWDPYSDEVYAHSADRAEKQDHLWRHHSEYAAPKFYDKWIPESIGKYLW